MAQQPRPQDDATAIQQSQSTAVRTPQFIGGAVDPETGNIVSASRLQVSQGPRPTGDIDAPPPPTSPTTRLGDITADSLGPAPIDAAGLAGAAAGAALPVLGSQVGASLGSGAVGETVGQTVTNVASDVISGSPLTTAGSAGLGSLGNALGAAGAGVGQFVGNLITGKDVGQAALSGGIAAAGFAIGNAVLPGIGGAVGSFLATTIFCYGAGTPIIMADGERRPIEDIELMELVLMGGTVLGVGKVLANGLYEYRGNVVTGTHAVFERGRFIRVADSEEAVPIDDIQVVYPMVTEHHLIVTDSHVSADFAEVDDGADLRPVERLELLNSNSFRLKWIANEAAALGYAEPIAA